jgi:hypothetical protein
MEDDSDISFDVPRLWQVCKLNLGTPLPAGMRMEIYRFQRVNGEALTGPTLVDVCDAEGASQVKILFEKNPLVLIDSPSNQQRQALLQIMANVANELNDEELDGGLYDSDQARNRAMAMVRSMLSKKQGN